MANLPTLKVLLDDGTGAFPYNITPYVLFNDGYEITRGRDDWQSAVTAGELTITLNNSDGRFTPGSTLIASPSPILVDRRIRLQEVVNGVTTTRFTGYVKSWPVEWPETVATFARVRLTATCAQARGERRTLRSALAEEINADAPTVYYTLTEPIGSTSAGDTSAHQAPPLVIDGTGTAPTFGGAHGVEDKTSVTFTGGQYLTSVGAPGIGSGSTTILVETCFFGTVNPPVGTVLVGLMDPSGNNGVGMTLLNTGAVSAFAAANGTTVSTGSIIDVTRGLPVYLAARATFSGGNVTVDMFLRSGSGVFAGVAKLAGTPTAFPGFASNMDRFSVGSALGPTGSALPAVTADVSNFAVTCTAGTISDARVTAHGQAATTPFAGEAGTARMTRIAGYAGIPVGTLDPSLSNLSGSSIDGSTAWEEIQAAADAEFGVAFIDSNGSLAFHNRNEVVSKTTPDLTLSSQWVTPDVAPVTDDQQLINYMEVTAKGTGATGLARNAASETTHGRYPGNRSYAVQTDAEAIDRANWLVSHLAEPVTRYGTLTINLYAMTPALASTVLAALEIDCWLRVTSMASQNPGGTTADVIVQGWRETVSASGWQIQCNVVSRSLFSPVWILGDPVYSILGSTTVLYV